jgi:hypothetical protein
VGRWQYVLQRWAAVQGRLCQARFAGDLSLQSNPFTFDSDLLAALEDWVAHVVTNAWEPIPPAEEQANFLLVTDGSAEGWCGILISYASGKATVASGTWPEPLSALVRFSSHSEPLALLAAANALIESDFDLLVRHVSDNQGNVKIVNKGYSTCSSQVTMEVLAKRFPRVRFVSDYYDGDRIPADEPSRGKALNTQKLSELCSKYNIDVTHIRDVSFNTNPVEDFEEPLVDLDEDDVSTAEFV